MENFTVTLTLAEQLVEGQVVTSQISKTLSERDMKKYLESELFSFHLQEMLLYPQISHKRNLELVRNFRAMLICYLSTRTPVEVCIKKEQPHSTVTITLKKNT